MTGACDLASGYYGYPGGMGCGIAGGYGFVYSENAIVPCGGTGGGDGHPSTTASTSRPHQHAR